RPGSARKPSSPVGPAIGGHPVAELGLAADELTLAGFGVVPLVDPFALDQQSHGNTPFSCLMRTGAGPWGRSTCHCGVGPRRSVFMPHPPESPRHRGGP